MIIFQYHNLYYLKMIKMTLERKCYFEVTSLRLIELFLNSF
jgi:hypothetical protein